MSKEKHINAESDELVLRSNTGAIAIVPAFDREKVLSMLDSGSNGELSAYIAKLPRYSDYAAMGMLITNNS